MILPWENIVLAGICLVTWLVWMLTLPRLSSGFLKNYLSLGTIFRWIFISVPVLQIVRLIRLPMPSTSFDFIFIIVGLVLCMFGSGFAVYAKLMMHNNWGLPAQHDIKRQKHLVTSGPYSISRNPIYTGLIVMFVGIELTLRSYLILLTLPLFIFIYLTIIKEEQLLKKYFGEIYLKYKNKVSRFI